MSLTSELVTAIQVATTGSAIRSAIVSAFEAMEAGGWPSFYSGPYSVIPSASGYFLDVSNKTMANSLYIEAFAPAVLVSKTISENGVYEASSDSADGFSQVTVSGLMKTWEGTLSEYNALGSIESDRYYFIIQESSNS